MLIIRKQQMKAFAAELARRFAVWMVPHARLRLPDALFDLDDAECERRIVIAIGRAQRRGVGTHEAIYEFALLALEMGARFDEHALIEPFYAGGSSADAVTLTLRQSLRAADIATIRAASRPQDWS